MQRKEVHTWRPIECTQLVAHDSNVAEVCRTSARAGRSTANRPASRRRAVCGPAGAAGQLLASAAAAASLRHVTNAWASPTSAARSSCRPEGRRQSSIRKPPDPAPLVSAHSQPRRQKLHRCTGAHADAGGSQAHRVRQSHLCHICANTGRRNCKRGSSA